MPGVCVTVVAARAVVPLVPSLRCNMERTGAVSGVPMDYKTKDFDIIEEDMAPNTHPEAAEDQDIDESSIRRPRISMEHIQKHGLTPGCRRCELHRQGRHVRAKHLRHAEACRSRIYGAIEAENGQVSEEETSALSL